MEATPSLGSKKGEFTQGAGKLRSKNEQDGRNAAPEDGKEKVFLFSVILSGEDAQAEDHLEELRRLAETAGAQVVGESSQRRPAPDKTYFLGKGKAIELSLEASRQNATLLIVDNDLSPAQERNLEQVTGLRVMDRTQLIMDIFAAGARTIQARKQVELAQLQYYLPRLKRLWSHLSRIRSGIGMRGPGETQLEVDRRIVRRKIGELKRELKTFESRKALELASRMDHFKICLVGYTNTGKSSLLNRLTGAGVVEEDRLFSTLDTRTRQWRLSGNLKALLSDTVGFIRKLPPHLVASFHATLEEAAQADLLLHVVDGSHPAAEEQIESVCEVLHRIGAAGIPQVLVLNKMDLVEDFMEVSLLQRRFPNLVPVSARSGEGLDALSDLVKRLLLMTYVEVELEMPLETGNLPAFISRVGEIVDSSSQDGLQRMKAKIPPYELGRLRQLAQAGGASCRVPDLE